MSTTRKPHLPTYRLHKQSGQAVVTLPDGTGQRHDVLLGPHGTPESMAEYRRVLLEWEVNGRRVPTKKQAAADLTICELLCAFWRHAETYYRDPDGQTTSELESYKYTLRPLKNLYGHTRANDFGAVSLKTVRQQMIADGLARGNINMRVNRIRRVFKWAAENELAPASVFHALLTVTGLKRGRSQAKDPAPVCPVARAVVERTLLHLQPTVADMARLQLETGMRPGELVIMRARDLDTTGKVWLYRPRRHKTEYHGHTRVVPIGPKGQEIVRRYLTTCLEAYLFSPAIVREAQYQERRSQRKSKVTPSQADRKRTKKPQRAPRNRYHTLTYARAISRACDLAFPPPEHLQPKVIVKVIGKRETRKRETRKEYLARLTIAEKAELREWRKAHHWHPHQLRHTRALELKREAGLDVARAVLGHKSPVITEHYATLDMAKASEVMGRLG